MRPKLKNIGDLRPADFVRHPIWINCHIVDYDEKWYDETTEETMRPYIGPIPVGTEELYSVRCTLIIADGTTFDGFATPADEAEDWGRIQPRLLLRDRPPILFWQGMFPSKGLLSELCEAIDKRPDQIFPIMVAPVAGLTTGVCTGTIRGFMRCTKDSYELVGD